MPRLSVVAAGACRAARQRVRLTLLPAAQCMRARQRQVGSAGMIVPAFLRLVVCNRLRLPCLPAAMFVRPPA